MPSPLPSPWQRNILHHLQGSYFLPAFFPKLFFQTLDSQNTANRPSNTDHQMGKSERNCLKQHKLQEIKGGIWSKTVVLRLKHQPEEGEMSQSCTWGRVFLIRACALVCFHQEYFSFLIQKNSRRRRKQFWSSGRAISPFCSFSNDFLKTTFMKVNYQWVTIMA